MNPSANRTRRAGEISCVLLACLCPVLPSFAGPVHEEKLPSPAKQTIDFNRDIQPIFEQSCYKCHGSEKPKSDFDLTSRMAALKGGENGVDIVPGDSGKSPLIHYVAGISEEFVMPPEGKAPALTQDQISLLRAWIDQGATFPAEPEPQPSFSVTPSIRWTTINGDKRAFREQFWRKEHAAGGVERFFLRDTPADDVTVAVDGHVFSDDNGVKVNVLATRKNFGFMHLGYEQYQRYYDDSGGYAPLLPTNSFSLDRDLHLDVGHAWVDFGLAVPDMPQLTVGYEYQFRQGNKSTLQWGPIGTLSPFVTPTDVRNIFPVEKNIDESTHVLKLNIHHEINGWYLEDTARVEFYKLETSRRNVTSHSLGPTPNAIELIKEEQKQLSGVNTLHINKQVTDWWFASGGYLYSKLGGDASLKLNTVTATGAPATGNQWFGDQILLDRETHSGSAASLFGPWEGLSLSAGVQGEWTRQRSMGDANFAFGNPATPPLFLIPVSNEGNLDDTVARENVSLRFTKIPFTTLYAETRLQQETLSRFEEQIGGFEPFRRDTDADIHLWEYRVGFDTSPWQRVSFGAHYKRSDKDTDYTHITHFTPSGLGYPGFLLARDIITDEIEPRVVIRPTSWLRTTLSYTLLATDYKNATRGPAGGSIFAGNYDEHIYNVNLVLTPTRRLYLSSTFSYSNSRTVTAQNGANYLSSWQGDVYSVLSSATYALGENTDLTASYSFSAGDFGQGNIAGTGLPIGMIYDRHAAEAGITHQFKNGVGVGAKYGFYRYYEPSSGGANDFTAHTIFGMITLSL